MILYDTPWLERGEKLICLGDSLTEAKDGYIRILAERLADFGVKVINAGKGGDKTPAALARLKTDVIDAKPDAVLIFLGTNDAAIGRGKWSDEPRVEPAAYKNNLIWIVHLCRLAGIAKFSIATPACRFEGAALADSGDTLPSYCLAAREAADETRSRLVPVDAVFAQEWQVRGSQAQAGLLLTGDGVHMTEAGNQLIARTMLKTWKLD